MLEPPEPNVKASLNVWPNGQTPAKYGSNVYRFLPSSCRILMSRGWRQAAKTAKFYYLASPKPRPPGPPFVIDVKILGRDEAVGFARQLKNLGKPWTGRVGEWDAIYEPIVPLSITFQNINPFTAKPIGPPKYSKSKTLAPIFIIGSSSLWYLKIRLWDDGPEIEEEARHIVSKEQDLFESLTPSASNPNGQEDDDRYEGTLNRVTQNKYERNRGARKDCIKHYGPKCVVCGFDFAKCYGEFANGYIHVHHLVPVSSVGQKYKIDPIKDLRPVCPNCHVIIHFADPPHTIEEVRRFMNKCRVTQNSISDSRPPSSV